jgi:hypothetical protein
MSGGVNGGTPTEWLRGQKSLPEWHTGAGKFFSGTQVKPSHIVIELKDS